MSVTIAVKPCELKFNLKIVHSPGMPPSKIIENPYTWPEVREIVKSNKLENFARSKESTERYHRFKQELREKGITIFKYLLTHQLNWYKPEDNAGKSITEIEDDSQIVIQLEGTTMFENDQDWKILFNHFPYHFEEDVTHLCIWSKVPIPADPNSPFGDISPQTRRQVDQFLDRIILLRLGIDPENMTWFKNWAALQSVKAISHIHVIIKGITKEQLGELHVC